MNTLLERLTHEKAAIMLANKKNYPNLHEKTLNIISKTYHWADLKFIDALDMLSVLGESTSDSFLLLRLSKCFEPLEAKIELDYSQISHTAVEEIGCNPYISSATYFGREMTEYELELLNNDSQFVYDEVISKIY